MMQESERRKPRRFGLQHDCAVHAPSTQSFFRIEEIHMLEKLKYFKKIAELGALLERTEHWQLACVEWEKAADCAQNGHNRHWAECRADVCRRRLSSET
jgi:hypothetical protein